MNPEASPRIAIVRRPLVNAIFHATGKRIRTLPVTPDTFR
jgi:hypothetical protein